MMTDLERNILLFISEHYYQKFVKLTWEINDVKDVVETGSINHIYYDSGYICVGLDSGYIASFPTKNIRFICVGGCDFQYSELERNNRVLNTYPQYDVDPWFTEIFYNGGDNFTVMLME